MILTSNLIYRHYYLVCSTSFRMFLQPAISVSMITQMEIQNPKRSTNQLKNERNLITSSFGGIHHKRCNYCNVIWKNSPKNNELTQLSQRIDALSNASETKQKNGKGKIFPASCKPIIFSEEKPGTWYKTMVNTHHHIDSSYSYNSSHIAIGHVNTLRYCCTKKCLLLALALLLHKSWMTYTKGVAG